MTYTDETEDSVLFEMLSDILSVYRNIIRGFKPYQYIILLANFYRVPIRESH